MNERMHACPSCELFNHFYFNHLDIPVPIDYFTCHNGIYIFVNIAELINHFSVHQHPKRKDDINRYHQFFYIWISFYQYCSIKIKEGSSHISFNTHHDPSIKLKEKLSKWNKCNVLNGIFILYQNFIIIFFVVEHNC